MFKRTQLAIFAASLVLACSVAQAQQFEVVHSLNFENASAAKAALDTLFADEDMKGGKATLYAYDAGERDSSHLIVEDFDRYEDRVKLDESRRASHGWSKFLLATQDSEYLGSEIVKVVDDHGKARHTAGYLAAFLINTTDADAYRRAIRELHERQGDPGVLRLVALRSGNRAVTHAVLIGGKDFASVNQYLDKLFASTDFKNFVDSVSDIRTLVGVTMYRRVAAWGY